MVKPNRTREEEEPLDRDQVYEEARKEEERLKEIAAKHGKLRLDIESDATREKTPPVLITGEDGVVIDTAEE